MRKNKKEHLSYEERCLIEKMLDTKYKQKEIAFVLKRGVSTISKEIKRGKNKERIYSASIAHHKAYLRQYWKKKDCLKVEMDIHILNFVEKGMRLCWSPEMISERLRIMSGLSYASSKAIRKYIDKRRKSLIPYLFWERHNRRSGVKRKKGSYLKDDRLFIEDRDLEFENLKDEYGHWEGDFIVSRDSKDVLLVLVEKLSKTTLIDILPNRKNTLVNKHVSSLLSDFKVISLTLDNDIAFQNWRELQTDLNCSIFFTNPYHSWEKGLVENMNRWIRQFIPKKTNIGKVSKSFVKRIEDWLNSLPRPVLDGRTAEEVMTFYEKGVSIVSKEVEYPVSIWG